MFNRMAHSLIVGGSKGLGKAVARKMLERGDAVSIISRSVPLDKLEGARYYPADLEHSEGIIPALEAATEDAGVDYVVFAQRYRGGGDAWRGEIEVSLTGSKLVVEHLEKKFTGGDNGIVFVSSVFSEYVGHGQPLSYHLAKAGMDSMMRFFAANLGKLGIRVNSVTPFTFLKDESREFYLKQPELMRMYESIVPMGRIGTADDVADTILFFCGPQSRFVSGQNLYVDGGLSVVWSESIARSFFK
jgi:NAD(P)-dependent dehydrogenase (short-subunit alcohol dehydrogenase family)